MWLKETIRPYYLRWIYFPLDSRRRPQAFQDCWRYPFDRLTEAVRLPESATGLPDLVFYPMTDWHARIQRTQHLARAFAGLGFRILCLNPHLGREFESTPLFDRSHRLSRIETNIFELHVRLPREPVFHHRLLTAREEEIVADAVARVLPTRPRAIQMLSFPLWSGVARRFRDQAGFPIVYDCHDLLSGFGNIAASLIEAEKDLLGAADLVLFSSQGLMDRYPTVRKRMLVRNAVSAGEFPEVFGVPGPPLPHGRGSDKCGSDMGRGSDKCGSDKRGSDMGRGSDERGSDMGPVVGYVGALDSWFDVEAVEQSAALHPQCRFILAGRVECDAIHRLRKLSNVEFAGEIPYSRVPELLSRFRVALIPFRINPLTLMTNPIKLYEYFGCGLPVVSTPLPEAQAMGDLVYLGATPAEFARQVGLALEEDDPPRRARRREIALRESWESRARDIRGRFEELGSPA